MSRGNHRRGYVDWPVIKSFLGEWVRCTHSGWPKELLDGTPYKDYLKAVK